MALLLDCILGVGVIGRLVVWVVTETPLLVVSLATVSRGGGRRPCVGVRVLVGRI